MQGERELECCDIPAPSAQGERPAAERGAAAVASKSLARALTGHAVGSQAECRRWNRRNARSVPRPSTPSMVPP